MFIERTNSCKCWGWKNNWSLKQISFISQGNLTSTNWFRTKRRQNGEERLTCILQKTT